MKIPPLDFEGRGTMRSMVEGPAPKAPLRGGPSTALQAVPLPCKGRGGM
jgi:hypothetical protein